MIVKPTVDCRNQQVLDVPVSQKKGIGDCPIGESKSAPDTGWAESNTMQVLMQAFRNTQFSRYCWIWDYTADAPLLWFY